MKLMPETYQDVLKSGPAIFIGVFLFLFLTPQCYWIFRTAPGQPINVLYGALVALPIAILGWLGISYYFYRGI